MSTTEVARHSELHRGVGKFKTGCDRSISAALFQLTPTLDIV